MFSLFRDKCKTFFATNQKLLPPKRSLHLRYRWWQTVKTDHDTLTINIWRALFFFHRFVTLLTSKKLFMKNMLSALAYLEELKAEAVASRKCLERISETTFDFKPHPKSMTMGYLALLVAEIPLWITYIIEKGEIDFATFKHFQPKNTEELVKHFDENMKGAENALKNAQDQALDDLFYLKANGQVLFSSPKIETIASNINHWVHHRGQLTVYMRLNDIPVPSIYGPSADEKQF